MALYRVEIINDDGEDDWVEVEATSIGEATTKAAAMPQTESVTGTPALQRDTTRAARPTVGAGDVGEEEGGEGRRFSTGQFVQPGGGTGDTGFIRLPSPGGLGDPGFVQPPAAIVAGDFLGDTGFIQLPGIGAPGGTTFQDFTQSIDPDLFDPGSSTFVPPVVPPTAVEPAVPFRQGPTGMLSPAEGGSGFQMVTPGAIHGVDEGFGINRGLGPQPPLVTTVPPPPPAFVPPTAVPPAVVPPAFVPPAVVPPSTVWGATDQAGGMGVPPAAVPPAAVPPAVINPETGLPVITDRELFTMSPTAGYRRAFGNVFGPAVSGIGPIAEYLRRQQTPLTSAFRGSALRDFLRRSQAPALGPGEGGAYTGEPQFGATDFTISPFGTPAIGSAAAGAEADMPGTSLQDFQAANAAAEVGGAAAPATGAVGVAGMPAGYSFEDYLRTR